MDISNKVGIILTKPCLVPVLGNVGEIVAHNGPNNVGRVGGVPIILNGLAMQKPTDSKFIQ